MKRGIVYAAVGVGILGAAAVALHPLDWQITVERSSEPVRATLSVQPGDARAQSAEEGIESLRNQSKAFVQIAKDVLPAVVSITSERNVQLTQNPNMRGMPRLFGDDFFNRFFDGQGPSIPQRGSGSGVIVSADGYVLTNNHVVADADEIRITLEDGRTFDGELVGRDPKSDVAVVKIEADNLVSARLGDSDRLEVGEWVLAVGNPFQLSSTVTAGIVSATGRSNIGLADYEDFIQTDAAINPGNSGGALVNLQGDVVGINTAIATRNGGNQGIGFAIPINMARRIMDDLITSGRVVRGWLGVNIQNINEEMAEVFGLDRSRGALVGQVTGGSPAEEAGVRQGDVILSIDGQDVRDVEDLQLKVVDRSPGTKVDIGILRDGERRTLTARLGELEDTADAVEGVEGRSADRSSDLGLGLEELTRTARRELDLPPTVDGVLVTGVHPAKPAGRAGLRQGDVILRIGEEEVHSIGEFERAISDLEPGKPVLFLVRRGEAEIFLGVRMPKE